MKLDTRRFPRQLRHWSLHCAINALPSFLIAAIFLRLWRIPGSMIAMVLAIVLFVIGYSLVTSIEGWFDDCYSLLSRAVKIGTRIRLGISLLSLPLLLAAEKGAVMFSPDFWAGLLAVAGVQGLFRMFGAGFTGSPDEMAPLATFCSTILEGLILSGMLLMFSFFALLVLQIRARRKMVAG